MATSYAKAFLQLSIRMHYINSLFRCAVTMPKSDMETAVSSEVNLL